MKKSLVIAAGLVLILGLAAWAWAAAGNDACSPRLVVAETFLKLDLSDAQKKRVAGILKEHRPAIKSEMAALRQARNRLAEALTAQESDNGKLRQAYRELSQAGEKALMLAGKVIPRLREVLTPEQRTLLQTQREKLKRAAGCRRQTKTDMLDQWIERHS